MRKTFFVTIAITVLVVIALCYLLYQLFLMMRDVSSMEEELNVRDSASEEELSNLKVNPNGKITESETSGQG